VATLAPDQLFENAPGVRKHVYADRERAEADARLGVAPFERGDLGLSAGWTQDRYTNSELGLQRRHSWNAGLDGSWSPIDPLTTYAWYSYERFRSEQDGRSWGAVRAQAFDPSRDWEATDLDAVHTAGVGAEWIAIDDRLTLRVD
jgi:hypothetical protein